MKAAAVAYAISTSSVDLTGLGSYITFDLGHLRVKNAYTSPVCEGSFVPYSESFDAAALWPALYTKGSSVGSTDRMPIDLHLGGVRDSPYRSMEGLKGGRSRSTKYGEDDFFSGLRGGDAKNFFRSEAGDDYRRYSLHENPLSRRGSSGRMSQDWLGNRKTVRSPLQERGVGAGYSRLMSSSLGGDSGGPLVGRNGEGGTGDAVLGRCPPPQGLVATHSFQYQTSFAPFINERKPYSSSSSSSPLEPPPHPHTSSALPRVFTLSMEMFGLTIEAVENEPSNTESAAPVVGGDEVDATSTPPMTTTTPPPPPPSSFSASSSSAAQVQKTGAYCSRKRGGGRCGGGKPWVGSRNIEGCLLESVDVLFYLRSSTSGLDVELDTTPWSLRLSRPQLTFVLDVINENLAGKGYSPAPVIVTLPPPFTSPGSTNCSRSASSGSSSSVSSSSIFVGDGRIALPSSSGGQQKKTTGMEKAEASTAPALPVKHSETTGAVQTSAADRDEGGGEQDERKRGADPGDKHLSSAAAAPSSSASSAASSPALKMVDAQQVRQIIEDFPYRVRLRMRLPKLLLESSFSSSAPIALFSLNNVTVGAEVSLFSIYMTYHFALSAESFAIDDIRRSSANCYKRLAECFYKKFSSKEEDDEENVDEGQPAHDHRFLRFRSGDLEEAEEEQEDRRGASGSSSSSSSSTTDKTQRDMKRALPVASQMPPSTISDSSSQGTLRKTSSLSSSLHADDPSKKELPPSSSVGHVPDRKKSKRDAPDLDASRQHDPGLKNARRVSLDRSGLQGGGGGVEEGQRFASGGRGGGGGGGEEELTLAAISPLPPAIQIEFVSSLQEGGMELNIHNATIYLLMVELMDFISYFTSAWSFSTMRCYPKPPPPVIRCSSTSRSVYGDALSSSSSPPGIFLGGKSSRDRTRHGSALGIALGSPAHPSRSRIGIQQRDIDEDDDGDLGASVFDALEDSEASETSRRNDGRGGQSSTTSSSPRPSTRAAKPISASSRGGSIVSYQTANSNIFDNYAKFLSSTSALESFAEGEEGQQGEEEGGDPGETGEEDDTEKEEDEEEEEQDKEPSSPSSSSRATSLRGGDRGREGETERGVPDGSQFGMLGSDESAAFTPSSASLAQHQILQYLPASEVVPEIPKEKPFRITVKVSRGKFILYTDLKNPTAPIIQWSNDFYVSMVSCADTLQMHNIDILNGRIARLDILRPPPPPPVSQAPPGGPFGLGGGKRERREGGGGGAREGKGDQGDAGGGGETTTRGRPHHYHCEEDRSGRRPPLHSCATSSRTAPDSSSVPLVDEESAVLLCEAFRVHGHGSYRSVDAEEEMKKQKEQAIVLEEKAAGARFLSGRNASVLGGGGGVGGVRTSSGLGGVSAGDAFYRSSVIATRQIERAIRQRVGTNHHPSPRVGGAALVPSVLTSAVTGKSPSKSGGASHNTSALDQHKGQGGGAPGSRGGRGDEGKDFFGQRMTADGKEKTGALYPPHETGGGSSSGSGDGRGEQERAGRGGGGGGEGGGVGAERSSYDESVTPPDGYGEDEEKKVVLTDFVLGFDIPGKPVASVPTVRRRTRGSFVATLRDDGVLGEEDQELRGERRRT